MRIATVANGLVTRRCTVGNLGRTSPTKLLTTANGSGKQAFSELPFNTQRLKNLKFSIRDAMFGLDQAETRRARMDVLNDLVSDGFASGWLYCCLKQQFRSKNHSATEPDVLEPHTNATATTDSDASRCFAAAHYKAFRLPF